MSDVIYANFINRRNKSAVTGVPLLNHINVNVDVTKLSDTFDFQIAYGLKEQVDLRSHDFVEFYFTTSKGLRYQIFCGYVEDFVRETTSNAHTFSGSGRNFLGQTMSVPFLSAKAYDQTSLKSFLSSCLKSLYLNEYLGMKGVQRAIVDRGAYAGRLLIPELSDSKIAPILQQTADEVFNVVYQNRFGQAVIWGRKSLDDQDTGFSLQESGDTNVNRFMVREDYSQVFSEVKVQYVGAEGNINYADTPSKAFFNSEPRARQIFQPEIKTFQSGTLITYSGAVGASDAKDMLAKSILRRSNQHLLSVVIQTSRPYYKSAAGDEIPFEVNQLWTIRSTDRTIDEKMRLTGIGYRQTSDGLTLELRFHKKDTLV